MTAELVTQGHLISDLERLAQSQYHLGRLVLKIKKIKILSAPLVTRKNPKQLRHDRNNWLTIFVIIFSVIDIVQNAVSWILYK